MMPVSDEKVEGWRKMVMSALNCPCCTDKQQRAHTEIVDSLIQSVRDLCAEREKEAFEAGIEALWKYLMESDMLTEWAGYGRKMKEDVYADFQRQEMKGMGG